MAIQRIETSERERAERGAERLLALPSEASADPLAADALADIPSRLGVAFVSPIFQALAHWPEYLSAAWTAYRAVIDSPAYRSAVNAIRPPDELLESLPPRPDGPPGPEVPPELRDYLALQGSLLPELLLLATTWLRPRGGTPVAVGAPAAARTPRVTRLAASPDEDPALAEALRAIKDAHGHPRILSVYRTIAGAGPFFLDAVPALLAAIGTEEYETAVSGLLTAAEEARLEIAGIPEPGEGPAEILAVFRTRMIPSLILDTAILQALTHRP